jgi:hypothetical protein
MYAETIEARTKCEECGKAIVEGYIDIEMAPSRPKEPARHPAPALARRLPGKIQDQTPFTTAAGLFKNETTRRQVSIARELITLGLETRLWLGNHSRDLEIEGNPIDQRYRTDLCSAAGERFC